MYLDRIEMTGFKSFADKTVIAFDKGVTAVVGPNGSGKSNLSEALKWVLGEQSAKGLRGKKMEDIIFAGSQTRKPVNIAEVTVVLNNEDHFLPIEQTEIQLTRRYHRNGESECFINKKPCRLKDIVDLLLDSGLGRDSFSMISQGKIESIFYNKPEERRAMFEEVAGVLKYKNRKHEASRKLEKTEEHLDRVEDILHEVNQQLGPLEKKRETALIYQEKTAALKTLDIGLMVAETEVLNAQWQTVKQEVTHVSEQLATQEADSQDLTLQLEQLREQLRQTDAQIETQQARYVNQVQKQEQLQGQYNTLSERLHFSLKSTNEQQRLQFEKEETIKQLTEQARRLEQDKSRIVEDHRKMQGELARLRREEQLLLETDQETRHAMRDAYVAKLQEQTRVQNATGYLAKEIAQLSERLERLTQERQGVAAQIEQDEQKVVELEQAIAAATEQLTTKEQAYNSLNDEFLAVRDALQAVHTEREAIEREVATLEAKRHSLQELNDDYAGFYQGPREVLKHRKQLAGIHGAVAELLEVPAQFTVAIDVALGATMQHVIVSDEQAAQQAIHLLKSKRLGRATFLPLTVMKATPLPGSVVKQASVLPGYLGVASDLIHFDKQYAAVFQRLLGQTLIVDNLSHGQAIAKTLQYRYRIVSVEGEIIHAGGSMTGGASQKGNQSNLLNRQATLDELTKQLRAAKDKRQTLMTASADKQTRLSDVEQLLKEIQQEATALTLSRQQQQSQLAFLQERLAQSAQQTRLLNIDMTQLERLSAQQAKELSEAEQTEQRIVKQIQQLEADLEQFNISEEDKATRIQALQQQLQSLGAQVAVATEQIQQLTVRIKETNTQRQEAEAVLSSLVAEQESHSLSHDELEQMQQNFAAEIKAATAAKDETEKSLATLRQQKATIESEETQLTQQEQDVRKSMQSLWNKQNQLATKQTRLEVTIDNNLNHLREEYALTFEAASALPPIDIPLNEATQQVKQLRQAINQLGPVDLTAIDAYQEVLERSQFLTQQQEDLLAAKEKLWATMNEMDSEVSKRFGATFYAIKAQFEKTFPKLFGGGRASLELTDPNDLLESGIDIIAQPPGKRLQNLSLLSGGEKAFTAIALLFAILEVKPVPFCLLDEVEAALDEANVARYGRYLKTFTQHTQFIVITHRKGTMEEADVLYGVTMQESGVSRLASVRFEQADELLEDVAN